MTRRSRVAAFAVAVAGLATGCVSRTADQIPAQSPPVVAPHATAVKGPAVRGVVRDPAGRPVAGATVTVAVSPNGGEQFVSAAKAFSSLGLLCFTGCTPPHDSAYSARDGSFALAVPGPNPEHDKYTLTVTNPQGETARETSSLLLPRRTRHGLSVRSVLVAARPLTIRRTPGRYFVVPPPLPGAAALSSPESSLEQERGSPPVADGGTVAASAGYDPRVVEDEHMLATTVRTGRDGRYPAIFSATAQVTGDRVPPSRGSSCWVVGSRGQHIRQRRCGLTDGVLDRDWQPADDPRCADGPCPGHRQAEHRDVTVVFRHAIDATLLVVRGCDGCSAMVSRDGRQFAPVGREPFGSANDIFVRRLGGEPVRAVRIQTDTGGFFDGLREVSVWPAA